MNMIQVANRLARENAKNIANIIKRDAKRVGELTKVLKRAGINVQNVYLDSSSYNISITGARPDLDIMFGVLRRAGLTPDSRPQEKQPYYSTFWRWEDNSGYVWVSFSSTTCKRVQVGTKTEEVPVYDVVCEE